jgi:protein polybromo-1
LEHAVSEGVGCVQKYFASLQGQSDPIVYSCLWRNCIRVKRNQPALPNLARLVKHVREVHVIKAPGKTVQPQDRGRNYVASTRKHLHQNNHQNNVQQPTQQIVYHQQPVQQTLSNVMNVGSPQINYVQQQQPVQNVINYVQAPVEPLFVTVPPRPQRVLHSEAYIKYIEGLQNNSPYVGQFTKSLKATKESLGSDISRLPIHWLGEKAKEKPEEVIDALWNLRSSMWRDALALNRNLF